MMVKYYFMPTLKARSLGKSSLEVVQEAISSEPPSTPFPTTSARTPPRSGRWWRS
jgi:hypothetical protein